MGVIEYKRSKIANFSIDYVWAKSWQVGLRAVLKIKEIIILFRCYYKLTTLQHKIDIMASERVYLPVL